VKEVRPTARKLIKVKPDPFYATTLGPAEPSNRGLYWMHSAKTIAFAAIPEFILVPQPGKRSVRGHGVTEYGLVAVLVVAAIIGALALFGKNINLAFSGMVPHVEPKPPSLSVTHTSGASGSSGGLGAGGDTSLDSALSGSLSTTVMTSGVNGSSTILANAMETVANQALQTGNLTEDQYNTLIQLSNQAHKLAEMEAVIEAAAENYRRGDGYFLDLYVTYEGRRVTIGSLYDKMGYKRSGRDDLASIDDPLNSRAYSETQAFIDLYNDLERSGALSDSYMNSVVTRLSTNILYLNDSLDIALRNIVRENIRPSELQDSAASTVTTSNAVSICTTGNGTDSGSACSNGNNGNGKGNGNGNNGNGNGNSNGNGNNGNGNSQG
jgi:Flp pilus assembly pilin Flp